MATYFIKYPGGKDKRKTFSILRREGRNSERVGAERLAVINARYLTGEDFEICRRLTVELKEEFRKAEHPQPLLINDNRRVVERYFASRTTRHMSDPYAARRELIRAADACGSIQLEHCTLSQIQDHVDNSLRGRTHLRICRGINRLLRSLGKTFRLQGKLFERAEPQYLLLKPFLTKLEKVQPREHMLLFATLFATGARLGEAFLLEPPLGGAVWIKLQLKKVGKRQYERLPTKTKVKRNAVVIPELQPLVQEWCELESEKKLELRPLKWSELAREALGLRAHDLRHCYAKRLSERGCTIKEIAASLGNSEQIARVYYAGWVQTEEQIEAVIKKLRGT